VDFGHSPEATEYLAKVRAFVRQEIEPIEADALRAAHRTDDPTGVVLALIDTLKPKAREQGLWNLFLPEPVTIDGRTYGAGLSNRDYAPLAEAMGSSSIASEVFNCNAPDTGNAEVLVQFGSDEQKSRWLAPLLDGEIRSAFCMTEPGVASSDARNMAATAIVKGDEIVLNGRKWWTTNAGHPNCRFGIFMGLSDPDAERNSRHSMVLVPFDAPGVKVERMLPAMGRHDEPNGHGEVSFTDVRLPVSAVIGEVGGAFHIAQSRLGPGRVHHCMRAIGLAEMALELACRRGSERVAFGRPLVNLGGNRERIGKARIAIEQARLLVLKTAWLLDTQGLAGALSEVSQIKALVPAMAQEVIDMAIQLHGGGGVSDDFPLAAAFAGARSLRLADGPDEVHLGVVARLELAPYAAAARAAAATAAR
jgi:acyl-CoA dehydrogenase